MADIYSEVNTTAPIDYPIVVEAMMDRVGPHSIAEMAEEVCKEKAAHIRENWQDERTAKYWDNCAAKFRAAGQMIRKLGQ